MNISCIYNLRFVNLFILLRHMKTQTNQIWNNSQQREYQCIIIKGALSSEYAFIQTFLIDITKIIQIENDL